MDIFKEFYDNIFQKIGKYYSTLSKSEKLQILDEAEQILAKNTMKTRLVIRYLRRRL